LRGRLERTSDASNPAVDGEGGGDDSEEGEDCRKAVVIIFTPESPSPSDPSFDLFQTSFSAL
jgi:hypothetical protein